MATFTRSLLTVILVARYIHLGELVVSLFSVVIGEDEKKILVRFLCSHISLQIQSWTR